MFILEADGQPVAQARVETTSAGVGEISVSVDPGARGRGLGSEVIARATTQGAADLDLETILARIKPTNLASKRAFAAAGYANTAADDAGEGVVVLRWTRSKS